MVLRTSRSRSSVRSVCVSIFWVTPPIARRSSPCRLAPLASSYRMRSPTWCRYWSRCALPQVEEMISFDVVASGILALIADVEDFRKRRVKPHVWRVRPVFSSERSAMVRRSSRIE